MNKIWLLVYMPCYVYGFMVLVTITIGLLRGEKELTYMPWYTRGCIASIIGAICFGFVIATWILFWGKVPLLVDFICMYVVWELTTRIYKRNCLNDLHQIKDSK